MKTPIKSFASGMMLLAPSITLALGLGDIDVQSKLNEPLRAEIRLLYSDAEEAESTNVALASADDFERVGLQMGSIPMDLVFELGRGMNGDYVILVTSSQPVTEPFVDFLIEVNWANGRLLREYVVLLDPPVVAPAAGPAITPVAEPPMADPTPVDDADDTGDSTPSTPRTTPSSPTAGTASAGEYGPVPAGDTLWEIARDYRPSSDVSINQMMVMVLQMNPDAFYEDNINALKRGAILRLPDAREFDALSATSAFEEVKTQNQVWESYRLASATRTPTVSDAGVTSDYDSDASDRYGSDTDSRLEIVPPSGDSASSYDQPGDTTGLQGEVSDLRSQLSRTREDLISATQENSELQSRVDDLESLVGNLERAITLKDADLADLQAELDMARQGVSDLSADTAAAIAADSGYDDDSASDGYDDDTMTDSDMAGTTGLDAGLDAGTDAGMDDSADMGYDDADDMGASGDTDAIEPDAAVTPPPTSVVSTAPPEEGGGMMSMLFDPKVLGGAALVLLLGGGGFWWQRRRKAQAGASLVDAMMTGDDDESWQAPAEQRAHQEQPEVAATVAAPNLENSLTDAVQADPTDPQNHLALLRSYYSDNERDKFVAAAETMLQHLGGTSHPAWNEVKGMGTNLAADHPLFAAAAEAPEEEAGLGLDLQGSTVEDDDDLGLDLDFDSDDAPKGLDDDSLNLDLDDDSAEPAVAADDDDLGLDLDFDSDDDAAAAPAEAAGDDDLDLDLDLDDAGPSESDDDMSLDLDLDDDSPAESPGAEDTADELEGLDFDLEPSEPEAAAEPKSESKDSDDANTEFDLEAVSDSAPDPVDDDDLGLGDLDLDLDAGPDAGTDDAGIDALDDDDLDDLGLGDLDLGEESLGGGEDEVGTKLDLARAYIEMGDPDGARGMLEEVVADGSDDQKAEAKKLLSGLG